MEQHLEIEFKTEISPDDHITIYDYFPFSEPVLQENRYYDTENNDLFKRGVMCRTRKIKDVTVLTIKEPLEEGVMEYEATLTKPLYECDNAQIVLDEFGINVHQLVEITFSTTVRYEYKDVYGTWCLDITQFANHKDFELEYELHHDDNDAENHFYQTLKSIGIPYIAIKPKFVRALDSLIQPDVQDEHQV